MSTAEPFSLFLDPDCGKSMSFIDFLKKAAKDDSLFDSAWRRAKRRRDAGGFFSPAGEGEDAVPDPYLLMLAAQDIRSWKAFGDIAGNEYTVEEMFAEEPFDRMLSFIGPPGSGKSVTIDRFVELVLGETFHMIDGCPVNCPPERLLRLLSEKNIKDLCKSDQAFGKAEDLLSLRARALEPCDHCKAQIFGTREKPALEPNLSEVKIQPVNLLSRKGHGIAFWTPSDNAGSVSLESALRQGSHLAVLAQPFAQKGHAIGKTPPLHPLLEAVQGKRRLQDGTPYSGLVILETNEEGFKAFKDNVNDVGAYKRRMRPIVRPYVTSISRELSIYERFLDTLQTDRPSFDPLVLESIAVLAVFSRIKSPKNVNLTIAHQMRIHDGDLTLAELIFKDEFSRQTMNPRYTTGSDQNRQLKVLLSWLRDKLGSEHGFQGLNEPFMLDEIIKPLVSFGMTQPGNRVTFLAALEFLSTKINDQLTLKDADADDQQKAMYVKCMEELKLTHHMDSPNTVEAWYRRRLRQLVQKAFFPDHEERLHTRFINYFNLATAVASGKTKFADSTKHEREINDEVIKEILTPVEVLIKGVDVSVPATKDYRKKLTARTEMYLRAEAQRLTCGNEPPLLEPTWDTLPELKRAVCILEAGENFAEIQLCLDSEKENSTPLDAEHAALRQEGLKNLKASGYSDESLNEVLRYIRANRLWLLETNGHDLY
jgi:predicted Ser/Thr protein kinase